jgi:uncharacterized protein (DUF1697 family)
VALTRYVALLRGINVGGRNVIRMSDLEATFEELGLADVATYIQSGNVLFTSGGLPARLAQRIETALSRRFTYLPSVVLVSGRELAAVVTHAPKGFGSRPAEYRYDVIFLKKPLTAKQAVAEMKTKEGVDRAWPGNGVLYFSRLISGASQSQLSRIVMLPIYKRMTIRNWNTTTKLAALVNSP